MKEYKIAMGEFKMRCIQKKYADYQKELQKVEEAEETILKLERELVERRSIGEGVTEIYKKLELVRKQRKRAKTEVYVLAKLIIKDLPEDLFKGEE